jgi:hypothetical protein
MRPAQGRFNVGRLRYLPSRPKDPWSGCGRVQREKGGGGDVMERAALEQPPSFGATVADKKNLFQDVRGMAGGAVIAAVVGLA